MKTCVVDAWAFSEWLKAAEPAASRLDDFLAASQKGLVHLYASAVNIGEVYYSLLKKNAPALARDWRDRAPTLPVKIEVPTMEDIWQAAEIKGRFTISYADAFAAALAQKVRGTLVTGDPDFRQIHGLKLDWVGTPY